MLLTIFTPASQHLTSREISRKEKYVAVNYYSGYYRKSTDEACRLCSRIGQIRISHIVKVMDTKKTSWRWIGCVCIKNPVGLVPRAENSVKSIIDGVVACKVLGRPVGSHGADSMTLHLA